VTALLFEPLQRELRPLTDRLAAGGHRLYLVGGTVRDLLLARAGREAAHSMSNDFDIDLTTTARPDAIKRCLDGWADTIWTQGERFGTIGAMKRLPGPSPGTTIERIYEITTHRAEAYRDDSRKPDVDFSHDVRADLSRRDFTVNAMAVELTSSAERAGAAVDASTVVDPFGGEADLAAHRLRTPMSPQQSFSDDPLRMLRAARFIAKYGLKPEADLVAAVGSMCDRLAIVSAERIRDELHKLLAAPVPDAGLRFCIDAGVMRHVVPELGDEAHLARTAIVMVGAVGGGRHVMRLAALVYQLEQPGRRLRALRHSTADVHDVVTITRESRRLLESVLASPNGITDAAIRRQVSDAGPLLGEVLELTRCAAEHGSADAVAGLAAWRAVNLAVRRIEELGEAEDLSDLGSELDGSDVMNILAVPAGREVGAALEFLRSLRLEEGLLGRAAATERLVEWWRDRD
jgi:poly(A) polymerase